MLVPTKVDQLIEWLKKDDVLQATLLIHQGIDLDKDTNMLGQLPLVVAIEDGDTQMFRTLVELGANVRNIDRSSGRARSLHIFSLQKCNFEIADYIEEVIKSEPRQPHSYTFR